MGGDLATGVNATTHQTLDNFIWHYACRIARYRVTETSAADIVREAAAFCDVAPFEVLAFSNGVTRFRASVEDKKAMLATLRATDDQERRLHAAE